MATSITGGHHAIVYVGSPAEAVTDEAWTLITANTKYQASKTYALTDNWVWSPTATLHVHTIAEHPAHGTEEADPYTLDRLRTTIDFGSGDQGAGWEAAHDWDCSVLHLSAIGMCHDFSLNINPKVVDKTPFGTVYRASDRVINTVSGTLTNFFDPAEFEADSFYVGSAAQPSFFLDSIDDDDIFVVKLYFPTLKADGVTPTTYEIAMWAKVQTEALKNSVEGITEETVSFYGVWDADGHVLSHGPRKAE